MGRLLRHMRFVTFLAEQELSHVPRNDRRLAGEGEIGRVGGAAANPSNLTVNQCVCQCEELVNEL